MDLENIIPNTGPAINEVKKYINKYNNEIIVIKCGGSVLLDVRLVCLFAPMSWVCFFCHILSTSSEVVIFCKVAQRASII